MNFKEDLQKIIDNDYDREKKEEFYQESAPMWKKILNEIFGDNIPDRKEWVDIYEICNILNIVGKMKTSTHMFFNSGGWDLDQDSEVIDSNLMILMGVQGCNLIKPKKLVFHKLDINPEWCYFRLMCEDIDEDELSNKITDTKDMHIYERIYNFEESELSLEAEKGNILIFMKASKVNFYIHNYMGNLNKLNEDSLREYLMRFI